MVLATGLLVAAAGAQDGEVPMDVVRQIKQAQDDGSKEEQAEAEEQAVPQRDASVKPQSASVDQVRELILAPGATAADEQVNDRLIELTDRAAKMALASEDAAVKLRALSVQMQSLYARLAADPRAAEADRLVARLRAAARRAKALELPDRAAAVEGDFWLMTADLVDVNRIGLPHAERQAQAAQLMAEFLKKHPAAPMADDVRAVYAQLQRARGLSVEADADPLTALKAAIAARLSEHWRLEIDADAEPITIGLQRGGENAADPIAGHGGRPTLYLVPADHERIGRTDVAEATEIGRWRGRTARLTGGGEDWPTLRTDLEAALKATDGAKRPTLGQPPEPPPADTTEAEERARDRQE